MELNIYLITRADRTEYDEYDSAVVIAETEAEAQSIHPDGHNRHIKGQWTDSNGYVSPYHDWCLFEKVRVKFITAYTETEFKAGDVICASFQAG